MGNRDRDPWVTNEIDILLGARHQTNLDVRAGPQEPDRVDLGLSGLSQGGDEGEGLRGEEVIKRFRYLSFGHGAVFLAGLEWK